MDLDLLITRASKTSSSTGGRAQNNLNMELCLIPDMSFKCSGTISGLLLGATTRTDGNSRNLYPEVQLWRKSTNKTVNETVFTKQASQEIRLNPGDFSPDGVLQYNLTTPILFQSGDVLGVYQPRTGDSIATLYYSTSNSMSYCIENNLASITLQSLTDKQILISPITGEKLYSCINNYASLLIYDMHRIIVF